MQETSKLINGGNLANLTTGVIFMSVPHFGTPVATASCQLGAFTRPSREVQDMKAGKTFFFYFDKDLFVIFFMLTAIDFFILLKS